MGGKIKQDGLIEYIEKVSHKLTSDNFQTGSTKYRIFKHVPLQTNQKKAHRSKRSSLESRKKECKDLKISSAFFEGAAGVASAATSAASSIPFFGSPGAIASAGVATAMYTAKAGIDLTYIAKDCDDVAFDEIKEVLMERFNKVDKGIDRNFAALQQLSKTAYKTLVTIEQTRIEMHQGFSHVLESIKRLKIEPVLSEMNIFMQYFDSEKDKINNLSKSKYITRIHETNNVLSYLKDSITPQCATLYTFVYTIINRNFAYPEKATDISGFSALYALHYGTQTFFSVMFFLLEQHCYLADYYYQKRDLEMYNKHFDNVQAIFDDFRNFLVGEKSNGLIDKVISTIAEVQQKSFIVDESGLLRSLTEKIEALIEMKREINEMILPVIDDVPKKLSGRPKFKNPGTSTPIGEWKDEARVEYAMQYKHNGIHSKVGDWSRPLVVHGRANPILRIPPDTHDRTRLIFRKFNDNTPQMVGIIEDRYQTEFWDVDRDLYNAASWLNEDLGEAVVSTLIQNGANVNAVFDQGRTAIHAAAEGGSTLIAMHFLNDTNINIQDDDGHTPLHLASIEGNDDFIQMLIDHGADVNAKTYTDQVTALHLAVRNGFVPTVNTLLLSNKIDVNVGEKDNFTPLHNAVDAGLPVVKALLANGKIDVNSKSTTGLTPLHLASINNHVDIAEALSTNSMLDVNIEAEQSYTPLHFASIGGHLDIVKFFERNETNLNARTDGNWTPLHFAVALKNDIIAMELLNEARIEVNLKIDDSVTPLHIAVGTGQENVILNLLKRGALIEDKTKDGLTPLHIASMHKNKEIVAILVDSGAFIESKSNTGSTPLLLATEKGNLDIIKYLSDKNANFKAVDNDGNTVVHLSAKLGHNDIIKYFVDEKDLHTIIESKSKSGSTALLLATEKGNIDIIKYLSDKNANFKAVDNDGNTVVHLSAKFGHYDIIKYFVDEKGLRTIIETKSNTGSTPLLLATEKGNLDIIKYLLDKNANFKAVNNEGNTVVHLCAKFGHYNIIRYFVDEKGFYINENRKGSPLYLAIQNGHLNIVKYLAEERNLDVTCKTDEYDCPLYEATKYDRVDVVRYLVNKNPKINLNGLPLQNSAQHDNINVLKYLIEEKGVNINAKSRYGETPLHIAASYGWLNIVKYLIEEKKVDFNTTKDVSPLYAAVSSGNLNLVKYFIEVRHIDASIKDSNERTPLHYAINGLHGISLNDKESSSIVQYLVDVRKVNVNARDSYGNTPLYYAARYGSIYPIKFLISRGANLDHVNEDGQTAWDITSDSTIEQILNHQLFCNSIVDGSDYTEICLRMCWKLEINSKCVDPKKRIDDDIFESTALNLAITYDESDEKAILLMEKVLGKGLNLNVGDQLGNTPLHVSVQKGKVKVINKLIRNGADIDIKNNDKKIPVDIAKENNYTDIIEILNKAKFDQNLRTATETGNLLLMKEVIQQGAHLDTEDKLGNTLVHIASSKGYIDILNYLVENGCNIHAFNKNGRNAINLAISNRHFDIAQILLINGAEINTSDCFYDANTYWETGKDQDKLILEDANLRDMCLGMKHFKVDTIKLLLDERNCLIKNTDGSKQYEIYKLVKDGTLDNLKKLLKEQTINLNYLYKGLSPLADACLNGRLSIVKYLIENGSDVNKIGTLGCTPMHWSVFGGHLDIVKYLIENADANRDALDAGGRNILHYSVMYGRIDILKYLLNEKHLDIDSKDSKNNTVVHFAAEWGKLDILKYLIDDKHAKVNTKNDDGSLPLHKAAGSGYVEAVKSLDDNNKTPLFKPSEDCHLEIVKYLTDKGANITGQDNQGYTPTITALRNGQFCIARFFIMQKGARKSIEDEKYLARSKHLAINACLFAVVESKASRDTIEINHTAVCLENNFALGLLLLQNFVDKKYPLPSFVQVTPEEARASALELTEKVEEIIKKSTKNNEVMPENIDFYQLYVDIETAIKNEKFSNVREIISKFIDKLHLSKESAKNVGTVILLEMITPLAPTDNPKKSESCGTRGKSYGNGRLGFQRGVVNQLPAPWEYEFCTIS